MLYYALKAFEESNITDIVLVTGHGETEYCRRELVEKYAFTKVTAIVEGGKERYHSVYEGLKAAKGTDYVLIHDGARPFVDEKLIARLIDTVKECQACVAAVPVKDTIKIADGDGFVKETPDRSLLWQIQTPQAFFYPLILDALFRSKDVEKSGTGFSRMDKLCKKAQVGWRYEKTSTGFKFIFIRNIGVNNGIDFIDDDGAKIIQLMKNKNTITVDQIATITMLSSRTVQRIIKDLSTQGKISRIDTKGGHWVIK